MHVKKVTASVLVGGMLLVFTWILAKPFSAVAQTPAPPVVMPTIGILTPPPTVFPPTQADQGAQVYFYICLVCHGNKGQGLDAWRKELQPPDNNCWQSKCHAPNHMDFGFTFPKNVPPVKAPGFLESFGNAKNLHDFMQSRMPFQQPGYLTDAEYWQLTAFLMRLNGRDPGNTVIGPQNAAQILFTQPPAQPQSTAFERLWPYAAAGLGLILAGILIIRVLLLQRKRG